MRTHLLDDLLTDLLQVVRFFVNIIKQEADIRMHSHGLRQLLDDKSVASYQQTCCKLIVKTCYPQALLQVVLTRCNEPANDKLGQA